MKAQVKQILLRLKKPSVVLSIVSQIITITILLGFDINESLVMAIAAAVCSILVMLGIMSNPDTQNKGYGDDVQVCSGCGETTKHVLVNGQLVCTDCGTVHSEDDAGQLT